VVTVGSRTSEDYDPLVHWIGGIVYDPMAAAWERQGV
jgi:hypothetical protein